jgi:hypothetical protein
MADLSIKDSSQTISIAGINSSGVETNFVDATANGDLGVVDGISSGGVFGNLNLVTANTAYELKVGANKLANRKLLTAICLDSDIFWGYNNTVTTANGFPLYRQQVGIWELDPQDSTTAIWVVCSQNNKNLRITESP